MSGLHSHALSFYRSQNVLGWSKFFVPDQKCIYILYQSQKFCARQKDDLHTNHGLAQNIWTGTKHFGTCKRTRHEIPNSLICMIIKYSLLTNINKFSFVSMGWTRAQFSTFFTPKTITKILEKNWVEFLKWLFKKNFAYVSYCLPCLRAGVAVPDSTIPCHKHK